GHVALIGRGVVGAPDLPAPRRRVGRAGGILAEDDAGSAAGNSIAVADEARECGPDVSTLAGGFLEVLVDAVGVGGGRVEGGVAAVVDERVGDGVAHGPGGELLPADFYVGGIDGNTVVERLKVHRVRPGRVAGGAD